MKSKIHLFGRHSNRTPFSYSAYRPYLSQHFDYEDDPLKADFLISGFCIDFRDNAKQVLSIIDGNPNIRLAVVSEEPLWDTIWSNGFQKIISQLNVKNGNDEVQIKYHVVNHVTSNVFNFEKIPYFITTNDDFYIRYSNLFLRNKRATRDQLLALWRDAKIKFAFYAAKRMDLSFDVSFEGGSIQGLNRYRSLIAEAITGSDVVREGQGWGTAVTRQALPDWHLDKLAALDKQSFIVSALENTHLSHYISEKLFDAFAVQAIPIYCAQPNHRAFDLVESQSFINVAGLSIAEAKEKILNFEVDGTVLDAYLESQSNLASCFSNPKLLFNERKFLSEKLAQQFKSIVNQSH